MGVFDQIIQGIPAEDRVILDKYPALRTSTEKLESDLGQVSNFAGQWVNWQKENWDPAAGNTKEAVALRAELDAAEARLAAGVSAGADTATIKALESKFDSKLAEVQKQSQAQIEGMNYFYRSASTHLLPHQKEFGENLDPQKLMEFMQQNKISDPDTAYDKMVSGRRAELATQRDKDLQEKHAADIAAAEQKGYEKRAQELAMGPGGMLPTDNTGGIAGITARIDKPAAISDEVKAKVGEAKLGDGSLAQLGYEMFRRGEFSGTTQ